ncbi:hypothetical protein L249_2318 [Ophiocordyceps polyrhachis-furcata BCC 54312]|uniref:Amine oxidase domain-containing protein n=1 Tax=Ophiocordyceps polyrhachis-furcata BCC 54312 TaxID=1330021 RepID=A0A367LNN1_9HYPO|nr:hypothetical protein L249_2318 [Ophiocordyceps polyrhachis-furcata BCC 54312]
MGRLATALLSLALLAFRAVSEEDEPTIISRDVCILGGGSSGTYAAVRLKDQGKSVVVVEPRSQLGGHAETWYFQDGSHINYGVEGVFNDHLSRSYLQRLGVQHKPLLPAASHTDYVNFKTGFKSNYTGPTFLRLLPAVFAYWLRLSRFDFLAEGLYIDLPDPVPEELLQPFGDFIDKHKIPESVLDVVFAFASAVGNLFETPLLYVVKDFGIPQCRALLSGYITPVKGMYEIYRRAKDLLGEDNILFRSKASRVTRNEEEGVTTVVVVDEDGKPVVTVRAKQLLVTMPLTPDNTAPLDLTDSARALFRKWRWKGLYTAVLNNTGIPDGRDVANEDPAQRRGFPLPPFQRRLQWMGVPGHHVGSLVAERDVTPERARELILDDVRRMAPVSVVPEVVAFADHSPSVLMVSNDDIRAGFYRDLYALQGRGATFYTGASMCSDYSSLLWAYTDDVIGKMTGVWNGTL